jgi:hypothetical protein
MREKDSIFRASIKGGGFGAVAGGISILLFWVTWFPWHVNALWSMAPGGVLGLLGGVLGGICGVIYDLPRGSVVGGVIGGATATLCFILVLTLIQLG